MDSVNYDDFENICRVCLLMWDDMVLLEPIISGVYYKITGIPLETNDELPQQMCIKCYEKLNEIDAFVLKCKQDHNILMTCLNKHKEQDTVMNSSLELDYEITVEEHKIEFIKVEEFNISNENAVVCKLQIKTENIEQSDDINNHQNINSLQNDSHENGEIEEMSDDNTNRNDLNDDTTSGSTNIKQVSKENRGRARTYKCDVCPKILNLKGILNVHKRKHSVKSPIICKICNKTFNLLHHLKAHKLIHSGERPYSCEICNKTFTQSNNLERHNRIHSGERPYACQMCEKTFTQSIDLTRHNRIHSGERPYACEICKKTFTNSSALTRHNRIHSGERPYACEICKKTFAGSNDLSKHKRIHSGERPYKCEICNKTFNQSCHLNRHKHIHRDERNVCRKSVESTFGVKKQKIIDSDKHPYKCDNCSKTFKRLSLLNGHKKIHNQNLNDSDDTE